MAGVSKQPVLLVTGGAGYIGSHVCKAAAAAGFLPVAFDNLVGGHRHAVRWGPLEQGDLLDRSRITAALERWRPLAVIHLAGLIVTSDSIVDPSDYYAANVTATLSLLDAMRRTGCDRIVFSSSAAVYGEPAYTPIDEAHRQNPVSPYGSTKLIVEQILRDFARGYGIRSASLRYFNAAGADPGGDLGEAHKVETHLIPLVLAAVAGRRPFVAIHGDDYETEDGTCVRDYVHVSDLATAHLLAMRFLGERQGAFAFNLGSETGASVRQIVDVARRVSNRRVSIRVGPRREGDPAILLANAARARSDLRWRPVCSGLEEIVATAWAWHKKEWRSSAN